MLDEFRQFFEAMEAEYVRHYPEKGDSWKICELGYLKSTLREVGWKYFRDHNNANELVDLANLCAMIWVRLSTQTLNSLEIRDEKVNKDA